MLSRLRTLLHTLNRNRAFASSSSSSSMSPAPVVNDNPACCSIPPVHSNYTPKGKFIDFAGFKKVYVTGPEKSDTAIVSVYDIFGFFPQTQQGADALATTLNATVYMPDFFEPDAPFPIAKFPPQTDDDKDALQRFFGGPAKPEAAVDNLLRIGKKLKEDGGVTKLGTYGMCWGGKVTILAGSGGSTKVFDAVAALHPAMLKAEDADSLSVPLGLFISNDEPIDQYEKMVDRISKKPFADKNVYRLYKSMFHGWAAARANLDDPENKKQFEDVYGRLHDFFSAAFTKDTASTV